MTLPMFAILFCVTVSGPSGSYCEPYDGPFPTLADCRGALDGLPASMRVRVDGRELRCAGRDVSVWAVH